MANKQSNQSEESRRRSRKEILQKRKEQEQKRNVYIGAGLILGLLGIIFLAALIIEFAVTPNQAIAEVNGEEITVREWEERVQFERTQRVIFLEDQLDTFGDVGFLQQNFPQLINELYPEQGQPELFAQSVKEQMVDDLGIQQAAEARGITVTDEEVDAWIEESFGYLGGVSPTPFPTPTETVEPTPSITPIATAVITELVPTNTPFPTVTPGPTNTPAPTPTPISEATYRQEYNELLAQYETYGISEAQYRDYVRNLLYREKLADALAEEQDLPQAVDHASFLFIFFESEEEANEAAAQIETDGFLQTWNEIRSGVNDNEESSAFASEILWRDEDTIAQTFGSEVAEAAMSLDLNQPSDVLEQVVDAETNRYFIIYITGREVRELSEGAYDQDKQEALEAFLVEALAGNVNYTDAEVGREPTQPRLDPIFFTAPTATPVAPLPGLVTPEN